ncbi:hypothetical protein [Saccharopolyspora hattusasensis]|uniref:hypothetical protein n=1 Tax=Saccharopolyspora hattusasensis TaxID=1128679 RepID=UPI003D95EFC4
MRKSFRVLFAGMTAAGLLAMGASPALAAKGKKSDDHSTVTAASHGGNGGNGGNGGVAINICPAIAVLAPAETHCEGANGGDANGGDAKATSEKDSNNEAPTNSED